MIKHYLSFIIVETVVGIPNEHILYFTGRSFYDKCTVQIKDIKYLAVSTSAAVHDNSG